MIIRFSVQIKVKIALYPVLDIVLRQFIQENMVFRKLKRIMMLFLISLLLTANLLNPMNIRVGFQVLMTILYWIEFGEMQASIFPYSQNSNVFANRISLLNWDIL